MKIESQNVTMLVASELVALDPISIILKDIAPGEGRLIVECYGKAWSAHWGGIGTQTIAKFVAHADADYLANRLASGKMNKQDAAYLLRICGAVREVCAVLCGEGKR